MNKMALVLCQPNVYKWLPCTGSTRDKDIGVLQSGGDTDRKVSKFNMHGNLVF